MGERKIALCLSKEEWNRMLCGLQWSQEAELERTENYRAQREKLRQESKKMAKLWAGSVENVQQKRLEIARQREEKCRKEREQWMEDIKRERAKEIQKFLEAKKKQMFYEKDNVKALNSALLYSEALRERSAQVEFQKKLQDIDKKREDEYVDKQKKMLHKYESEEAEEKLRKQKQMLRLRQDMRQQFQSKIHEKHVKEEKEKEVEREDVKNMNKAEEEERKARVEEENRKRQTLKYNREESLKQKKEFKKKIEEDDKELEKTVELYAKAKNKMNCALKAKEKQMRIKKIKKSEEIAHLVAKVVQSHDEQEEAILRKALAEKEAKFAADYERKKNYREQLVRERNKCYEDFLKSEEEKKKKEDNLRKWEMMQRIKQEEVNEKVEDDKKKKNNDIKLEFRKYYLEQMAEHEEIKKKEKEEEKELLLQQSKIWEKEDHKFIDYAKQVIEESKKKGRPLLPLLKVVEKHKKQISLGVDSTDDPLTSIVKMEDLNLESECRCK